MYSLMLNPSNPIGKIMLKKQSIVRLLTPASVALAAILMCACGGDSYAEQGPQQRLLAESVETPARYFGYAVVDCGYDDPLDSEVRTNYVSEVASFTNIGQMCAYDPSDNIVARLQFMTDNGMQAILSIQGIFFEGRPDATQGSGMKYTLYPNYLSRWNAFVSKNNLSQHISKIGTFYVVDEPGWNGVSTQALKIAADTIKASFPTVPVAISEAASKISSLTIPSSVDLIGLVHYAVPNPDTDPAILSELAQLKAKRTSTAQKIFLVMDAQWLPFYGEAGYPETYMASIATAYYNLAISDPEIIGIFGYTWPGGMDDSQQKGTRNLPESVIAEHIRIGKLITGK